MADKIDLDFTYSTIDQIFRLSMGETGDFSRQKYEGDFSMAMEEIPISVAVIVAHPDDETLWAGGMLLDHPHYQWFTVCLCRGNDQDRAPKFYNALKILHSEGIMGELDDGPGQFPLDAKEVEGVILSLLPPKPFDLIITHSPLGEYTRHLRHEETGKAVINLWRSGKISTKELWIFAYEDGNKAYLPRPIKKATLYNKLSKHIWQKKHNIITQTYGFDKSSFEAKTTPLAESFWQFTDPTKAGLWLKEEEQ
jgi:LmbE family N-acetylglucosaminyl deacetylase